MLYISSLAHVFTELHDHEFTLYSTIILYQKHEKYRLITFSIIKQITIYFTSRVEPLINLRVKPN